MRIDGEFEKLMLPLISFIIGIVVFFKGSFTLAGRTVVRPQSRTIGLILMAPLVIEFCASSMLVTNYAEFSEEGTLTISQDAFNQIAGTLGMIELVSVIIAVGLALYNIFGMPAAAAPSKVSASPQARVTPERVPDIMTVAEAAAYMRVSESDVLTLIDEGKLGAAKIGSTYRIARIAVDDFMGRG
jgi:excisionase family DNA binding protein